MTRIQANGITLDYETYGASTNPPLLMIMGLGMIKEGWQRQLKTLSESYYTIIFDNRGVGRSDRPNGPYTTTMMAHDALALLDALGIERAHVIGTSMGGMIAQHIALEAPRRVEKLVLAATYARIPREVKRHFKHGLVLLGLDKLDHPELEDIDPMDIYDYLMPLLFNQSYLDKNPKELAEINAVLAATEPSFTGIFYQVVATQLHNTLDDLPVLSPPTLVLVGCNDRLIPPRCSKILAERIPNAQFTQIQGGSHAFNWEDPEAFNTAVLAFFAA